MGQLPPESGQFRSCPAAPMVHRFRFFLCLLLTVATVGCLAGQGRGVPAMTTPAAEPAENSIAWTTPSASRDATRLSKWRGAVGPPLVRQGPGTAAASADLTVVSWNTDLGAGDMTRFFATLPAGPVIVLLQEVYREGPDVPSVLARDAAFARRKGGRAGGPGFVPVDRLASALGLSVYYVPSMRNGGAADVLEDRGNAILSNLPLEELAAIELPFERQRRVALAATIRGLTAAGTPWRLRVVDAHLDNTFNPRRLWLAAEYGRARQAKALLSAVDHGAPIILGGDFNTVSGFSDAAYLPLARRFPAVPATDRRATFLGLLRLDHLFFRLPSGWTATFRRADERFGSDHYPLVARVKVR